MAYAQTNYSQKVGNSPFPISDIGCLLTAFCNLLARLGEPIDPPALNQEFVRKGSYLLAPEDGPGIKDDLTWGSVSAHDGQVIVTGIGTAGWPDTNNAILKFAYKSTRTGKKTTHFALVADHTKGTIVDSWDGLTKANPYGTPVAWAKYERRKPQVVCAPQPPSTPTFTVEHIATRVEELKIDTHLWDLNQRTWPALANNPAGVGNKGTKFKTSAIAHHIVGGAYYLPDGDSTQGYNVVDCQVPVATPKPAPKPVPAPAPVPKIFTKNMVDGIIFQTLEGAPKKMYVSRPSGAEKWSFKDVTTWRGFKSVQHVPYGTEIYIVGVAHHPIPPSGADYYMLDADFSDFKKTGKVKNYCGFNWSDISEQKPPALIPPKSVAPVSSTAPVVKPTLPAAQVSTPPAASTTPVDWRTTYIPFPSPVEYITTRNIVVKDLAGKQPDAPLPKYDNNGMTEVGVVKAYGSVVKDGVSYYRLRTNNDPTFSFWYCVPKIDPETNGPNLLVMPAATAQPASKISVARDTLELAKAKIEDKLPFLDDILPKWFKNKK